MAAPAASGTVSSQGLNIAGHKIPYALVMAVVGVATLFFIMKQRGGSASIGAQPTAQDPSLAAANMSGQEAQLANIGQAIFSLQNQLAMAPAANAVATVAAPASDPAAFFGPNVLATATPWGAENLWSVNAQGQLNEQWTDFNSAQHTAITSRGTLATGLDPKTSLSTYWVGNNEVLLADNPAGQVTRYWWDSPTQTWHVGGYNGPSPVQPFQGSGQPPLQL